MARYRSYDYSQKVLLPVSLESQLMPGTLEFAINALVEEHMDLSLFDERYCNDATGRSAYDPKVMVKIILLAYSRGLISSRKIEQACRENVIFMALACGQCPDHSTIASFVSSMEDEILPLFRDVLLVCEEMALLGGTFFALDGCKLSSNASKEWSGTISDLAKKRDKLEAKVSHLLKEQIEEDRNDGNAGSDDSKRQRQIEKLRKKADRITRWLQKAEARKGSTGEVKSNVTDNESAKMMTSHGTIQGYNGQSLVDAKHQIIIHGEAFGTGQDSGHLPPMIDGAKANLQKIGYSANCFKGTVLTADTNYHSTANLQKCADEEVDAYIPDNQFRNRDPRFATQKRYRAKKVNKFTVDDFRHRESSDEYECPNGKTLKLSVKRYVADRTIYRRYIAREEDCRNCPIRDRCLYGKGTKRKYLTIPLGTVGINLSKEMIKKVDSERGRKLYPQRMAIVEPVFANIRYQKRLDRFTLRGKIKVNIQWILYCMVHNIEKIANYGFA
jgi:transposase